jgi:hypothetical protein
MTGLWSIIVPETSELLNLVENPSSEIDTTDYFGISATVASSTARARRGYKSISVTPTTSVNDGGYYDEVSLTSGVDYAYSLDFYGVDGIPYRTYLGDTAGNIVSAITTFTGNGNWQRPVVLYSSTASANFRLYYTKNNSESVSAFYVDGLQCVASAYDVSYIDGDQEDCYWTFNPHLGYSARKANSRAGGRVVNFDAYSFYLAEWPGAGDVEISAQTSQIGQLPGVNDEGEKVEPRVFDMIGEILGASSLADLHSKRKALLNITKSDLIAGKEQKDKQFWLVYSGANSARPVQIRAKKISGLSLGKPNGFSEKIALRLLATNPYWYEDGEGGAAITAYTSVADIALAAKRISGTWDRVSSDFVGTSASIADIARGPDGTIYLCGNFLNEGSTNGNLIVSYYGGIIHNMGTGGSGAAAIARCMAVDQAGDVYVGGKFSFMGGVADTLRIARWDGSAWNALASGIATAPTYGVCGMVVGQDGKLYLAGDFTDLGSTDGNYVASWDGTAFAALPGVALTYTAYCAALAPNGDIWFGSDYGAYKWDGTALTKPISSTDGTAAITAMAVDPAGFVYLGGNFTTLNGTTSPYFARWNGASIDTIDTGLDGTVLSLSVSDDGLIYATGYFSTAGGLALTGHCAVWNGATWSRVPFVGPSYISKLLPVGDDLYVGFQESATCKVSYKNTITNNGTARAYPKIVLQRSGGLTGRVEYIKNETTGAVLWLDYSMLDGEKLTIELGLGKRGITSSYFGNVIGRALLRNSDFADFYLLPGTNEISVFAYAVGTGAPATGSATWPITHLSLDGSST